MMQRRAELDGAAGGRRAATPVAAARQGRPPVPGPRGYPLIGLLPRLRRDPLRVFVGLAREHGDVVRIPAGPRRRVYLVNHPDHVRRVLQDNHGNYRLPPFYEELLPIFGGGLFTSEGDAWRWRRRLIQPALTHRRVRPLAPVVAAATAGMLERWERVAARGAPVDVADEAAGLTLGVVARAMFGADLDDDAGALGRAILAGLETAVARTTSVTGLAGHLPTPRNRRFARDLGALDAAVRRIVAGRREGTADDGGGGGDLLAVLLGARNPETGQNLSERELRDEVATMLVSGSVTTANALTWTWYLLARHPAAQDRVRAEALRALGDRTPSADDPDGLGYTKAVVQEALRLFPPTWRLARTAIGADEIGGHVIPAGATVVFSPYLLHRHPACWDDPEAFVPERFTPEASAARPRFAYLPFGAGPRACVGSHLATMEAQLVVAMVARRFRLALAPGHRVEVEPLNTLRPRHGLPMTPEPVAG